MAKSKKGLWCFVLSMSLPGWVSAQDSYEEFHGLQQVLENLYDQMIPLCSQLIGVARALGGFAALWFIAHRVWGHLSRAEPIDFYPLLRPFFIGFCIAIFPMVLDLINGILQPTVAATDAMVQNTNQALYAMLDGKQQQLNNPPATNPSTAPDNDPARWYQYTHPDAATNASGGSSNPIADAFSGFSLRNLIKTWIAEALEFFYQCAALVIDTIRTFKLVVLAILGPIVFGIGVFDGFQGTIRRWLARYVNVFMWLPVANIFGAITARIQLNMIQIQQAAGNTDPFFASTNTAYLIFLAIAIVGYFTVPSIAGYIVDAGGHALLNKISALSSTYSAMASREAATALASMQNTKTTEKTDLPESPGQNSTDHYMSRKISGKP
jgi:conjugative transposon TraJ protein